MDPLAIATEARQRACDRKHEASKVLEAARAAYDAACQAESDAIDRVFAVRQAIKDAARAEVESWGAVQTSAGVQ